MDRREIDQLWTLPLEDFTRARDDLAKRAKEEGDPDAAKEIRALRKPSLAAWTVNRLARERAADVAKLLKAGEDLRRAQAEALAGGGRDALRAATALRRRAVDQLVDAAAQVLTSAGHPASRTTLDRVAATLLAGASDLAAGERVGAGTLDRELAPPSGFEELAGMMPGAKGAPPSEPAGTTRAERERAERARARIEQLENRAAEAEQEADRLRAVAEQASKEADRAGRAAERAEARAAEARQHADAARGEAGDRAARRGQRRRR
jgi:hypothetical protein